MIKAVIRWKQLNKMISKYWKQQKLKTEFINNSKKYAQHLYLVNVQILQNENKKSVLNWIISRRNLTYKLLSM